MMTRGSIYVAMVLVSGCGFATLTPPSSEDANNSNNINNVDREPISDTSVSCSGGIPFEEIHPERSIFEPTAKSVLGVGFALSGDGRTFGHVGWAEGEEGTLKISVGAYEGFLNPKFTVKSWLTEDMLDSDDEVVDLLPLVTLECPNDKTICPDKDRLRVYQATVLTKKAVFECELKDDGPAIGGCVINKLLLSQGVFPPKSVDFGVAVPSNRFKDGVRLVVHVVGGDPLKFQTVSTTFQDDGFQSLPARGVSSELSANYATGVLWGLDERSGGYPYLGVVSKYSGEDDLSPIILAYNTETMQYDALDDQAWWIPQDVSPSPATFAFVQRQVLAGMGFDFEPVQTTVNFGYVARDTSKNKLIFGEMGRGEEPPIREFELPGGNIATVQGVRSLASAGSGELNAPFVVLHGADRDQLMLGLWDAEDDLEYYLDLLEEQNFTEIKNVGIRGLLEKQGSIYFIGDRDGAWTVGRIPVNITGGLVGMCGQ